MNKETNQLFQAKENYIMRKIAGKDVLIPIVGNVANFNGFIEMNPTAAFIWNILKSPASKYEIVKAVSEAFETDEGIARPDVDEFISLLSEHDMIEVL